MGWGGEREGKKSEQSTKTYTHTHVSHVHDIIIRPITLHNNRKKGKNCKTQTILNYSSLRQEILNV